MRAAIIVPFRDQYGNVREEQFITLRQQIRNVCKEHNQDYFICKVIQDDNELFNRGTLMNVAADLCKDKCDYFIFNDVDNVPIGKDNAYRYREFSGNICGVIDGKRYGDKDDHLGDIVLFKKDDFFAVNGFSNYYTGWGFEVSATPKRLKMKGVQIKRGDSVIETMPHNTAHRFNGNSNFVNNTLLYHLEWDIKIWEGYNEVEYEISIVEEQDDTVIYYVKMPPPKYDTTKILPKEWFKERLGDFNEEMYDWCIKTYDK